MKSEEILEKIEELLKGDIFNVQENLKNETKIKDFPEWDSFKHLAFMIEIENMFNIEITPDDFAIIETIGDLLKRITE